MWIDGEVGAEWPLAIWVSVQNMITAYGAEHTRLRRPAAAAFTARRAGGMLPRIEEVVGKLLDRLAALAPHQAVDLRTEFAHELPTRIVFELFGIPEHSWAPCTKSSTPSSTRRSRPRRRSATRRTCTSRWPTCSPTGASTPATT